LDKNYFKNLSHIINLRDTAPKTNTNAWKSVVIQETLNKHQLVFWLDTSIRFKSSNIKKIIDKTVNISMIARYIPFPMECYTNPLIYKWFGDDFSLNSSTLDQLKQCYTIESGAMMFWKSLLTELIMKAFVTCSLDVNCIAPQGSRLDNCCGCHRYDQSAISIITTFFYGYPIDKINHRPAMTLNAAQQDQYLMEVIRGGYEIYG
jgi:hypothetical protein